jgi:hypothetical protein
MHEGFRIPLRTSRELPARWPPRAFDLIETGALKFLRWHLAPHALRRY